MPPKKPRGLLIKIVITVLILVGTYIIVTTVQTIFGKSKYQRAITEVRTKNPAADNPCLGYSVLRSYTYVELYWKSESEIATLILKDPGSC